MTTDNAPTITAIAERLGVSRQTVYTWRAEGLPTGDVDAALAWQAQHKATEAPILQQLQAARLRKLTADSEGKELETAVTRGELVERDAVERWLSAFVSSTRQKIESWVPSLVTEIPGDVRIIVHDILSEQVRLLLLRLADMPAELWADETVAQPLLAENE